MRAALINDPKAGIHINKRKSGKRNFSRVGSSDGDDFNPKHKRARGRQKDKQISEKKNMKALGKKSSYNKYAHESDSSEEDSISGDSSSDEEPNDEDHPRGGDFNSDEDSFNKEPSDTDPSDEEPRDGDASDEDVSHGCYEGQCVAVGQYTQLLAGFTPTSTNPSPTNFPVSSPTSSAPNIANPVASIPQ
ncbi:hypothetical protein FRX31_019496, partial [Thalictrum thalictroides]